MLALAALAAGCGDDGGDPSAPAPAPRQAAPADFPPARGKATLSELVRGLPQGPQLAPSGAVLDPGPNRFGFALFDRAGKQVNGAQVALYTASAAQTDVRGPFVARSESLRVDPRFASRTSAQEAGDAKSVYVSQLPIERRGRRVVIALAKLDGRLVASSAVSVRVGVAGGPPKVGERAPRVSTPTVASAGGDVARIDTRVPPSSMHDVDFADVVGRKPVVIVFATPALCQSRVCGPVVDAAEQVKARHGDRVAWVHMEIYRDNDVEKGFRPQVRAWRLPSEPWVFAVGRDGRIAARIEGATSVREIDRAVRRALA